ncbi:MAG TPA: dienelactone hydrolase family protein [Bacteroidia bacterium]|jgi:carboxymethylenebutenolidase|nr:dienelactone hydrolase family protein [Bacteroidia bacterium]
MTSNTFVSIPVSGSNMQAYVATPEGQGPFPGIIVFQEAFGVNQHIREVTDRLAAAGYLAIAPELFHRTASPGLEIDYTDFPTVLPHLQSTSPATLEADTRAAYDWLQKQTQVKKDKIACIGFCLGGRASFVANTALPLKAAVSFYGGGIAPEIIKNAKSLHAPQLFFWGGLDKHIPSEQIDIVINTLKAENKPHINVVISDADHGFFCNYKPAYNAQAASEAWAMTLAFLKNKV